LAPSVPNLLAHGIKFTCQGLAVNVAKRHACAMGFTTHSRANVTAFANDAWPTRVFALRLFAALSNGSGEAFVETSRTRSTEYLQKIHWGALAAGSRQTAPMRA
jgi:hypothetical protein